MKKFLALMFCVLLGSAMMVTGCAKKAAEQQAAPAAESSDAMEAAPAEDGAMETPAEGEAMEAPAEEGSGTTESAPAAE